MLSPPDTEDNPRFARLTDLFRTHGLRTPQVHAADFDRGMLLLEDLGERDFAAAYAGGEIDPPLEAAVRDLVKLQSVVSDDIPPTRRPVSGTNWRSSPNGFLDGSSASMFPRPTPGWRMPLSRRP